MIFWTAILFVALVIVLMALSDFLGTIYARWAQ